MKTRVTITLSGESEITFDSEKEAITIHDDVDVSFFKVTELSRDELNDRICDLEWVVNKMRLYMKERWEEVH